MLTVLFEMFTRRYSTYSPLLAIPSDKLIFSSANEHTFRSYTTPTFCSFIAHENYGIGDILVL